MLASLYKPPGKLCVGHSVFLKESAQRKLCSYKPDRRVDRGFVGFNDCREILKPISMGKEMKEIAQSMDDWQRLGLHLAV